MNIGGRILWSHLKTPGVTVSVQRAPAPQVYLYKVVNMVDMGRAGRTAIMHPFDTNDGFEAIPMDKESHKKTRLSVPHRVGNLQFLYASKERARIMDMNYVMNCAFSGAALEKIVLDVLSPGDLLAVRPKKGGEGIQSLDALRIVNTNKKQTRGRIHAV
jgi:hypothetical protein